MITKENYDMLCMLKARQVSDDRRPDDLDEDRLNALIDGGYVTLFAFNREYEQGPVPTHRMVHGYKLTPAGEDAISDYDRYLTLGNIESAERLMVNVEKTSRRRIRFYRLLLAAAAIVFFVLGYLAGKS